MTKFDTGPIGNLEDMSKLKKWQSFHTNRPLQGILADRARKMVQNI